MLRVEKKLYEVRAQKKGLVEDTGIEPVTFRLPVSSADFSDFDNLATEIGRLVCAYMHAQPTMRQHVLALLTLQPEDKS